MNIDFLLYNPPKVSFDPLTLWGQVIFIPKAEEPTKEKWPLASFLNCYKGQQEFEVELSLEAARLETYGIPPAEVADSISTTSTADYGGVEAKSSIPCLFLNSLVSSRYLILYFHSSGEDIKLSHGLANHLRNLYQVWNQTIQINVVVVEYPGYSIYKGSAKVERVREDAFTVYDYLTAKAGFKPENIIVMGRSIGTGTVLLRLNKAIEVAKRKTPGALVLISAFTSIKDLAKQLVGSWSTYLIKDLFNNAEEIADVKCPIFLLHGKSDNFIPHHHSVELAKICKSKGNFNVKVELPSKMTHASFDYYTDLSSPLRDFLLALRINLYDQNMNGPEMPSYLFKNPLAA